MLLRDVLLCRGPLLSKGLSFWKHSAAISAFGREFAKTGMLPAELHRVLIDARQLREQGDYDAEATIDKATCSEQLSRTRRFVDAATAYLADSGHAGPREG